MIRSMKLQIEKTKLDQVLVIYPPTNFEDFRGVYTETYNLESYGQAGIDQKFVQDNFSYSSKNVLRGIHGDSKTWKLVSCISGSVYLLVVNNDKKSDQYKHWESFTLSSRNYRQILIPPNFGNGHLVLSESAIFHYKQTTNYDRNSQFTITWNDPKYDFWWPDVKPMTSKRDAGLQI